MALGPVQIVAYGFDRIDRFRGQILDELDRLEANGSIRVLDLLLVAKDEDGSLTVLELDDEAEGGEVTGDIIEVGELLALLLGFDVEAGADPTGDRPEVEPSAGLSIDDIMTLADELDPGTAAGILLVEHRWAIGFRDAVASAGGRPIMQGFLSPDAIALIGAETVAAANALESIETAVAIEGEALLRSLEALAVIEDVQSAVRSVIAADTVQTLIDGGLLPASAALDAALLLEEAGIVDRGLLA
ncbi:MAG: hypothetical protein OEX04_04400 [Acidimicrobiia bacterium]|nr:hypothetical protein [Acidimicrobiia bacterium]MDH4306696.1 hypothetical protein [Acidimicrobiia bacterium]MDH5292557.1 hypothetical protein [Acidimicrobiia bacterium]